MEKLAGRLTYLSFGTLCGASLILAYFHFATNVNVSSSESFQLWISLVTAITGGLSAYAAYNAAVITKLNHSKYQKRTAIQLSSATRVIKNTRDILSEQSGDGISAVKFEYPLAYKAAAELIYIVLSEPLNEETYLAYWDAYTFLSEIYKSTENGDEIEAPKVKELISSFDKCLQRIELHG
jgi:hypothetical protein